MPTPIAKTKTAKRQKTPALDIRLGDWVLLGDPRVSSPYEWYFGRVLWVGPDDILTERSNSQGKCWRQVIDRTDVRSVSADMGLLLDLRRKCGDTVRAEGQRITEAEHALSKARDGRWAKIEEIAGQAKRLELANVP